MQNAFASVDVERSRIKVGLIKTQATAAAVSITAAGTGCPGRIDSTSGRVVWLRSEVEFFEGIPLARAARRPARVSRLCDSDVHAILADETRFGTGRDCTIELQIQAAPHRSARKSRFQITKACALAGSEMLNACVLRACQWQRI